MEQTPEAEDVTHEVASVGGVAGWWCMPQHSIPGSAVAYFHGGVYVLGSAAYRNFVGQIATRANAPIFIVDYGLAPEHVFPAAINDAESVYRGLADSGFSRLAIAGDSAGGGLALALLVRVTAAAKEGKTPLPLAAAVMSPWVDLALTGESMVTRANGDPLLARRAGEGCGALPGQCRS